jgi:glycerol transport system ATP-binding protein
MLPNHLNNVKDKNFNLGIRASNIELSDNGFEFEVELAEISGSETLLHLKERKRKNYYLYRGSYEL